MSLAPLRPYLKLAAVTSPRTLPTLVYSILRMFTRNKKFTCIIM